MSTDKWESEFNPENVKLSTNLDVDVESIATEFRRVLDVLAPVKNCSLSLKPKKSWFNKELAADKAKVRHHEKSGLSISYHQPGEHTNRSGMHTMAH